MSRRRFIPEQKDEYLGNIWGWKFSFFGLALILVLLALMSFRACQMRGDTKATDSTEIVP